MRKFTFTKRSLRIIENSLGAKIAFKCFRQCSSSYISNKDLRDFLLNKFNNQCANCNSKNNLQIDHIVSVKRCFLNKQYYFCNSLENLQILCNKCNAAKLP